MGSSGVAISILWAACAAFLPAQELAHDSGTADGKNSRAGSGHVIRFEVDKPRWVTTVRIHGARYGGGYDATQTPFSISICDADMRELGRTEPMYSKFASGRFAWVDVTLDPPVEVEGAFHVVVAFDPARTKGVFVSYSETDASHSGYGLAEAAMQAADGREWMIRAVVSAKKPRLAPEPEVDVAAQRAAYRRDYDFLVRTIQSSYPALKKKGIEWSSIKREARKVFLSAESDADHVRNVYRLIAALGDTHSSVRGTEVEVHVPGFDGLYGAGLWIAVEGGRFVLRDWMPSHALEADLQRGAELVRVDGEPAAAHHDKVCGQLREWYGWSSQHFLDARISTQFFLFGDRQELPATFANPGGETVDVTLRRWGPGGRGLLRQAATMPEGLEAEGNAVSTMLDDEIGYVRILGGMNEATQAEFFAAVDRVLDAKALVLDCRGMGGGGDGPAWAMAGRFFAERTPNGTAPDLEPTGGEQFAGPIVMLVDERMVSSAETFTWALTETGRAVTVGRPTGGATIIPKMFELPSGLASFRLGVHDRKTPIRGVQPEGVGTAPDVYVPYTAELLQRPGDPALAVGRALAQRLAAGANREDATHAFATALAGDGVRLSSSQREVLPDWLR